MPFEVCAECGEEDVTDDDDLCEKCFEISDLYCKLAKTDSRLVSLQCRVETLFEAIMKDWPGLMGIEQQSHLKAKIEEHFKE